jgi:hypothetical protein
MQTLAFVQRMEEKWHKFDHAGAEQIWALPWSHLMQSLVMYAEMTIAECFEKLKGYVDSSDPDITLPNLEHMLQVLLC